MRPREALELEPDERTTLEEWAGGERRPRGRAVRARIVLEAAAGVSDAEIARRLAITPETVARWRARFRALGPDGLEREAPRSGAVRRVRDDLVGDVLRATLDQPADGAERWTTRSLARALGTSHMAVHRIWTAFGLSTDRATPPDRRPNRPLVDLEGVYRTPEVSAVVFGLVAEPTRAGAHPSPAGGSVDPSLAATELVGGLNASAPLDGRRPASGSAPGSLLVFLRSIERATSPATRLDAILDRPVTALGPRVGAWLAAHPRYRIFAPGEDEEWTRSAEAWFRRWENVPLDPASFRELHDFYGRATGTGLRPRPYRARSLARPAPGLNTDK